MKDSTKKTIQFFENLEQSYFSQAKNYPEGDRTRIDYLRQSGECASVVRFLNGAEDLQRDSILKIMRRELQSTSASSVERQYMISFGFPEGRGGIEQQNMNTLILETITHIESKRDL